MKEKARNFVKKFKNWPIIGEFIEAKPKVAVIRMSGVIADKSMHKTGINHNRFASVIDKAFEKSNLQALAIVINSPGGAPAQCSLISSQILKLSEEKEVPVFAFVEDVAASGGYWLACIGDEIFVQETSIVGSIGVISASLGFEDFIEKHNIHRRVYTAGNQKSFMDPFLKPTKEDEQRLEDIQKDIHESFVSWVKERRGAVLRGDDKSLFEGQIWTGKQALENGIADDVGDMKAVLREKFGDKVKFVDMTPERKIPFPLSIMSRSLNDQTNMAEDAIQTIEARALWSRFGL